MRKHQESLFISFPWWHPFLSQFMDISIEKTELAEWNAYNYYHQWPDKGHQQNINDCPEPILSDGQRIHNLFPTKPVALPPMVKVQRIRASWRPFTFHFSVIVQTCSIIKIKRRKSQEKWPWKTTIFTSVELYGKVDRFMTNNFTVC